MNLLCTDPGVIDYALTAGITDLQFAASYAVTSSEWKDGHHDYFCFVNRAGGEPAHRHHREAAGGARSHRLISTSLDHRGVFDQVGDAVQDLVRAERVARDLRPRR